MTKPKQLAREIQQYCAAHASPSVARSGARYFREGYDAWGLFDEGNPFLNERRREWLAKYAAIGVDGFIEAGEKLFASGKYEEGVIAVMFLEARRGEMDGRDGLALARWYQGGLGNWAHNDLLCGRLLAPLLKDGRLRLEALAPWRRSPLRYLRRAVPVAMLGLLPPLKKGQPAASADRRTIKRLLEFLRPMMLDDERVVHQGLGWFLREAWKKDAASVEPFLLQFKDAAARLIFQYATEKMTADGKARFRAAKRISMRQPVGSRRQAAGKLRQRTGSRQRRLAAGSAVTVEDANPETASRRH